MARVGPVGTHPLGGAAMSDPFKESWRQLAKPRMLPRWLVGVLFVAEIVHIDLAR
jgi:hypothetical protein